MEGKRQMQRRILWITWLLSFAIMAMSGCGTSNEETNSMKSKQDRGGLESDPHFHKHNSVVGEVKSGGKAVPGATVTIVATKETSAIEPSGFYILVLRSEERRVGKECRSRW